MAECVSTDEQYGESSMATQNVCFICEKPMDIDSTPIPVCSKCRAVLKALCTCPVTIPIKTNVGGIKDIPL